MKTQIKREKYNVESDSTPSVQQYESLSQIVVCMRSSITQLDNLLCNDKDKVLEVFFTYLDEAKVQVSRLPHLLDHSDFMKRLVALNYFVSNSYTEEVDVKIVLEEIDDLFDILGVEPRYENNIDCLAPEYSVTAFFDRPVRKVIEQKLYISGVEVSIYSDIGYLTEGSSLLDTVKIMIAGGVTLHTDEVA